MPESRMQGYAVVPCNLSLIRRIDVFIRRMIVRMLNGDLAVPPIQIISDESMDPDDTGTKMPFTIGQTSTSTGYQHQ